MMTLLIWSLQVFDYFVPIAMWTSSIFSSHNRISILDIMLKCTVVSLAIILNEKSTSLVCNSLPMLSYGLARYVSKFSESFTRLSGYFDNFREFYRSWVSLCRINHLKVAPGTPSTPPCCRTRLTRWGKVVYPATLKIF